MNLRDWVFSAYLLSVLVTVHTQNSTNNTCVSTQVCIVGQTCQQVGSLGTFNSVQYPQCPDGWVGAACNTSIWRSLNTTATTPPYFWLPFNTDATASNSNTTMDVIQQSNDHVYTSTDMVSSLLMWQTVIPPSRAVYFTPGLLVQVNQMTGACLYISTFSVWFQTTATPTGPVYLYSSGTYPYGNNIYNVMYSNNTGVFVQVSSNTATGVYQTPSTGSSIQADYTYHVVSVLGGTPGNYTSTVYVWEYDLMGQLHNLSVVTTSLLATLNGTIGTGCSGIISIGGTHIANHTYTTQTTYNNLYIWDWLVYNTSLTPLQVYNIYSNTTQFVSPCAYDVQGSQSYCYNGGRCNVISATQAVCNCTNTGFTGSLCLLPVATTPVVTNTTVNSTQTTSSPGILVSNTPVLDTVDVPLVNTTECSIDYIRTNCLSTSGSVPTCDNLIYVLSHNDPCCPACLPPSVYLPPTTVASCQANAACSTRSVCSNVTCGVTVLSTGDCGATCQTYTGISLTLITYDAATKLAWAYGTAKYFQLMIQAAANRYCANPVNWVQCNDNLYSINYMNVTYFTYYSGMLRVSLVIPAQSYGVTQTVQGKYRLSSGRRLLQTSTTNSTGTPSDLIVSSSSDTNSTSTYYAAGVSTTDNVAPQSTQAPYLYGNSMYSGNCTTLPCLNGGVCTDIHDNQHLCTCNSMWSGVNCEKWLDVCHVRFV